MARSIDLYFNSGFAGSWPMQNIELYFDEYYNSASDLAEDIDWDEVVLYAIYCYDEADTSLISADFMLLRMSYKRYVKLCQKVSRNCRLFIIRNL